MFSIPDELVELGKKRIEGYAVQGFVRSQGSTSPKLLLIGEAPGENEIETGIPFIGRAGNELMQSLNSIGLERENVYMTSPVRSRPYKWGTKKERDGTIVKRTYNRAPKPAEILAHAPLLDYEIHHLQPKLIVTLGTIGLQRLLGKNARVTELHGRKLTQPIQYLKNLEDEQYSLTSKTYVIVPTFHPASVFYRPSLREQVAEDWLKIGQYLKELT
ncbi:uracil-DNA glycosylase [Paenisporosarcina sp. FSL H8-0542]|uniref:uracil-DNA glycosylase n=1 Tax=Paenisporosarcina sp. FSL H8-0542 TaxID=2921401 RepID=UPI00315A093B